MAESILFNRQRMGDIYLQGTRSKMEQRMPGCLRLTQPVMNNGTGH